MSNNYNLYGLFGGTFDPIHYGHLTPLKEVLRIAELSQITYIPVALPAHRRLPEANAEHRLAMTRLAVDEEPHFTVDDIELKRHGISYTVDTLHSLRQRYPQRQYALIIGLDALLTLETWHRWQTLQHSVHIIALARYGWQLPQTLPPWWQAAYVESCAELRQSAGGKILFIETTPTPISATTVRARLKAGEEISTMTPRRVCDYIRTHNLYRSDH